MQNRIKQLIESKGMNASRFADVIGVPRSTISHILSGRNNPSLELVQKILHAFPDVHTDWLVRGRGSPGASVPSLFPDEQNKGNTTGRSMDDDQPSDDAFSAAMDGFSAASPKSAAMPGEDASADLPSEELLDGPPVGVSGVGTAGTHGIKPKNPVDAKRKVKQVILLYEDGSFSHHFPQ